MILNRQRGVPVSLASLESFWRQVLDTLRLPENSMTICLVSEAEIARWNRAYRSKKGPTDVLSFPAEEDAAGTLPGRLEAGATKSARRRRAAEGGHFVAPPSLAASKDGAASNGARRRARGLPRRAGLTLTTELEAAGYLGDIAIAPAVARRNARRLGRSFGSEMRILMLHGALHLLGYDHERDNGEMEQLERRLRRQLGLGAK